MQNISYLLFKDTELLKILLLSICAAAFILILFHFLPDHSSDNTRENSPSLSFVHSSRRLHHFSRKDWRNLLLIASLYCIVSFTRLGSRVFPSTTWQPSKSGQSFILELTGDTHFDAVYTIYGEGDNNSNPDTYQLGNTGMLIEGSNDLKAWQTITACEKGSIYEYSIYEGDWNYRYIRVTSMSKNDTLSEIGFRSNDGRRFLPVSVYADQSDGTYSADLVIDEQDKLVLHPTYYDEAYFDEVYHPRNAWEIANGQAMYATVHPLLGTNIMALSIKIFGMNPFAWRLPGAVCGVLILFVLYALLKILFDKTALCTIGTILCAADFMHLTTSRIATLEPYSILLILLMFYFMAEYYYTSFYDTPLKKQLRLLLACGISMGLAISAKWTACYSAVGLAVILFTNLFRRLYEYHQAGTYLKNDTGISESGRREALLIREKFNKNFWVTIALCFLFFIIIPAVIYWICYLPDHVWKNDTWSIANVWKQNLYMYNYHTNLKATHPYQSYWYEWLLDIRPIWYYYGTSADGMKHSISCFSNPLLTWAGLISIIIVAADVIVERNREAWFILIGYITALGPWVLFVNRCVFAYHFYPTSMFVILALVYAGRYLLKYKAGRICIVLFLITYIILFYMFLPVTAGFGSDLSYIQWLEWLPRWYFG